jgi:hypothetical protein|tara:strand:+ start:102 stop:341 length:240 start_codon:yes stop_codon:yes gene_type:complete
MKKTLLIIIILLAGCKTPSLDERGRLEKIRIMVPALIDIEFDYYKDEENKGKNKYEKPESETVNGYPRLMPLREKEAKD